MAFGLLDCGGLPGGCDALNSPGPERSLRGDRLGINPKPALHLVDHEADAAEHLLLGVAVRGGDQLADPVGEILVVSHRDKHGAWGP